MRRRSILAFAAVVTVGIVVAFLAVPHTRTGARPLVAQPKGEARRADQEELYRWFDSLGYTGLTKGHYVLINRDDLLMDRYGYGAHQLGFLTKLGPKRYRFIRDDLKVEVRDDLNIDERLFASKTTSLDLKKDVIPLEFRPTSWDPKGEDPRHVAMMTNSHTPGVQECMFFTSRIAQLRGFSDAAWSGYRIAVADLDGVTKWKGSSKERLRQFVASEILENIYESWIDPSVPKSELARELHVLADSMPDSDVKRQAREDAEIADTMRREEDAHALTIKQKPLHFTQEEQIQELIWQTRNLHFEYPNKLSGKVGPDPTLIDALADIGLPAVPDLLKALQDHRFTQASVMRWEDAPESPYHDRLAFHLLRVRDVAEIALAKIASTSFVDIPYNFPQDDAKESGVDDPEATAKIISRINKWWGSVSRLGERAALVKAVEAGDRSGALQAEKLAQKYPAFAPAAIQVALSKSNVVADRFHLVFALLELPAKDAYPLAKSEMESSKDLGTRIFAAKLVAKYDPEMAVKTISEDLPSDAHHAFLPDRNDLASLDASYIGNYIHFLVASERPMAAHALAITLTDLPVLGKLDFLRRIGEVDGNDSEIKREHPAYPAQRDDFYRQLESLLVSELSDREADSVSRQYIGDHSPFFDTRRPCDFAAYLLNEFWPKKYAKADVESIDERDAICQRDRNVWSASSG